MTNQYIIKAHSQSINKIVTRFEGEFEVQTEGDIPTEKLEDLIYKLKQKYEDSDDDLDNLIIEAFSIGANAGFFRALERFMDGKITTRKIPNEERRVLYSSSTIFRITKQLPSTKNTSIRAVVTLSLARYGFK